jgi:hypothetical protein
MRAVAFGVGVAAALGVASVGAASLSSPDDPVATARYVGSSPSITATAPPDAAAPVPVPVAETVDPDATKPSLSLQSALAQARQDIDAVGDQLSGLMTSVGHHRQAGFEVARYTTPAGQANGIQGWRQRLGAARTPGQTPRLFVFAGDQGGVLTYSFTRGNGQVGAAGWATERADQPGERRVGVAWQRGQTRFALTGLERKFCRFGTEMKDRVLALSVSFSPGWSTKRDRQRS